MYDIFHSNTRHFTYTACVDTTKDLFILLAKYQL